MWHLIGLGSVRLGLQVRNCAGVSHAKRILEINWLAAHTHGHVGAAEAEQDDEPFEQKMNRLTGKLEEQFAESAKLEKAVRKNLAGLDLGHERP